MTPTQENPRLLPDSFRKHDSTYTKLMREGQFAIYSVSVGKKTIGYEVIRVRVAKPQKLPGGILAPWREIYPSDEDFGRHGWYFMAKNNEAAHDKYRALCKGDTTA